MNEDLIPFQGREFKIDFTSQQIPTPESEPWPKSIQTVTMTNVCPNMTQAQTMFQLSLDLQGCSQMRFSVFRRLWLGVVKHIVKAFDLKSDEIFQD